MKECINKYRNEWFSAPWFVGGLSFVFYLFIKMRGWSFVYQYLSFIFRSNTLCIHFIFVSSHHAHKSLSLSLSLSLSQHQQLEWNTLFINTWVLSFVQIHCAYTLFSKSTIRVKYIVHTLYIQNQQLEWNTLCIHFIFKINK